ncbi:MAG: 3-isopropylmalate dehydratase small subunit [Candidatus Ratteibacteria bacterium]|jgi:3-isopropylmalate/(R)-2-methylmalate dehydratase small subunit
MNVKGKIWKFGDHINTDDIIAARYLNTTDGKELAAHCMETIRPGFADAFVAGDIVVAGENFGCGSSREHAPVALRELGVSVVVAKSFARIFLRNSINIGLPLVELEEVDALREKDLVEIDLTTGILRNLTLNKEYTFTRYPDFLRELIEYGGLMKWTQERYIR